ncbi:ABC transporter amino acid-binding protein [Renibacterium salmoninarum ATCC 33209]|uniref:ABC transporter amino acid-binding protein n=1 Tax=Renibacterium salmoninarum (strain ATCC 33209 / DSM 20767 / JCM 11484 / NBRC 15589 / NCIMB 2235) TaxID=288705 RepID=A9WRT3_RENSM|nr:ABC transporter substrate-binding protein [Renibacterium salmoninarum]ABY24365.1 ABC transporter amino acid-binding protein [Renibacterium salmoninarum ATCC 33209]
MKVAPTAIAKMLAILAVGALALSGCTYESEKLDRPASGATAAPFDLDSVKTNAVLTAQLPESIRNRGTLIVGSNTEYPPAEFLDASGKPTGYDIEMITAIAKKLGLKTEAQSAEFTAILPALGPKYDVGISSFTVTPERLNNVNMVSFLNVGTTWAVQKGNPKKVDLNNICGLSIGVQTGTTQEDPDLSGRSAKCKEDGKAPINIVTLKNQTDITTRLIGGTLDAMAADSPITGYAITQTNGKIERLTDAYDQAPQAIAVAKSDTTFAELIKKALDALKDDGSYKKVLDSWGSSDSAVDSFQVNPEVK